ncbi:hypothetical protein ACIG3E_32520 [Streptomyces sp. NPDC053474]|uniref:hypothetical protein n=1 Tax=Streptomyces sp. NPDC053474 TaxID=3365704 RepID=UPI0037D652B4
MVRRADYDEGQAVARLGVHRAAFRWARHVGLVREPDIDAWRWSRTAVEEMDAAAIAEALPGEPICGSAAADRIARALGTPNPVKSFVVRRFIARGLLHDLSADPKGSLLHPGQVDEVCARPDLAVLVAADTPLGPDQAKDRLGIRRCDFDHMRRLGWITPTETAKVQYGTSKAGAVNVDLFRAEDVDALPAAHPEVDFELLRGLGKGRRSPLAALRPAGS